MRVCLRWSLSQVQEREARRREGTRGDTIKLEKGGREGEERGRDGGLWHVRVGEMDGERSGQTKIEVRTMKTSECAPKRSSMNRIYPFLSRMVFVLLTIVLFLVIDCFDSCATDRWRFFAIKRYLLLVVGG